MKERIQRIIDHTESSSARFADTIGIQRSALSHILNGRNNASLDVVTKILATYPEISTEWLLNGSGNMLKSSSYSPTVKQTSLFDEISINTSDRSSDPFYSKDKEHTALTSEQKENNDTLDKQQALLAQKSILSDKRIVKIMIFYSDNTFETFSSDSMPLKP